MTKNIVVLDELYRMKGTTYEKRALGLVKNGRAEFVDENTIRLIEKPSFISLEDQLMNYIYFNAKDWTLNKEKNSIGERSFIQDFHNELSEVFQLGDWNYDYDYSYSEINSVGYALAPDTPYTFVFWLNGGENDRKDEVCRLEVIFDGDEERKSGYKLNRNFISPVLKYRGWELYAISFVTPQSDAEVETKLRFISVHAPMAVMAAKNIEYYMTWTAEPDSFERFRPQRHNIVFPEGWPTDSWYSTANMSYEYPEANVKKDKKKAPFDKDDIKNFASDVSREFGQFVSDFANGAKNLANSVKANPKTKDAVDKVKFYGSAVSDQVDEFISEMMSAKNQEKMQDVIKKVETAVQDAVAKGDQVGSDVLARVKDSLSKYRDSKKEEETSKEYDDLVSEEIENLEDELDDVEDQISDLEDTISDKEDAADDLDDEVNELNEMLKDAAAQEQKDILKTIKEKLMAKGEILSSIEEDRAIIMNELKSRRDDIVYKIRTLKNDFASTSERNDEKPENNGNITIKDDNE